jgi:hypothetical protein
MATLLLCVSTASEVDVSRCIDQCRGEDGADTP